MRRTLRRKVVDVVTRTPNAWGSKLYWRLKLECGHSVYTRTNASGQEPKTAGCDACWYRRDVLRAKERKR